jgi:hypothetical protein
VSTTWKTSSWELFRVDEPIDELPRDSEQLARFCWGDFSLATQEHYFTAGGEF